MNRSRVKKLLMVTASDEALNVFFDHAELVALRDMISKAKILFAKSAHIL